MQFNRRHFIGAAMAATAGATTASCVLNPPKGETPRPLPVREAAEAVSPPAVPEQPPLLAEALAALHSHAHRIPHRDRIGLVDFSRASDEPRFQIVDVASGRVEGAWLCAHGRGSDPGHTGMLQSFSNRSGSNATSRGAYLTANRYFGKYGDSQRLIGLDPDNDAALERAIVLHGAPYVDPAMAAARGRIGRSLGCFAVELSEIETVMRLLGEGRMIYAGKPA